MRQRYCIELMLPSRPDDPRTIDIWVWSTDVDKAHRTVAARLQRLIGDGPEDPGPELDDA